MVNQVIPYFENNNTFIKFKNMKLNFLAEVFGSPQQIFGIAIYDNENLLRENWERAGTEFAVNIKSQLVGPLHNLKWDMYLILVVESNVKNIELCKQIENDRMYFKKIVLAENLEEFHRKLPIELKLENSDQLEFFSDKQFLVELKKSVSPEVAEKLDLTIFENYSIDEANATIFLELNKSKGVHE